MSPVDRRAFLKTVAAAVPAAAAGACAVPDAATSARPPLDGRTLSAVADVVLPAALGTDGIARVVAGFQQWLTDYRPVAEATHGYGTGELGYLPADPRPGWEAQLRALDAEAVQRSGHLFADLDPVTRRAVIRRQLGGRGTAGERLPDPLQARHVALGLLAYWAATPEATNLCYAAKIDSNTCRPLADQTARPATLEPNSAPST